MVRSALNGNLDAALVVVALEDAIRSHIQYVQEVVTLQKKYSNIFAQKIRFTPFFFNYYDILGRILFVYRAK